MPLPEFKCASCITEVVIYAEGALVTRSVDVSAIPGDISEAVLVLSGISPIASSPTVQLSGVADRIVRSASVCSPSCQSQGESSPESGRTSGASVSSEAEDLLEEKHCRRDVVAALARSQRDRGNRLAAARPRISLSGRNPRAQPHLRVRDLLALSDRLGNAVSASDARLRGLIEEELKLKREIEAQELQRSQMSAADLGDSAPEQSEIRISIGGSGAIETLKVTYSVSAARWWPAYSLRFKEGGSSAEIALEAYLIQDCGEDWNGVKLSLCTASMLAGADMPKLASLRIGRAQPARPSGFRKPPEALDEMFASWDASEATAAISRPVDDAPPETIPQPVNIFAASTDDDDDDDDADEYQNGAADRDFENLIGLVENWKKASSASAEKAEFFQAARPGSRKHSEPSFRPSSFSGVPETSAPPSGAAGRGGGGHQSMMGRALSALLPKPKMCVAAESACRSPEEFAGVPLRESVDSDDFALDETDAPSSSQGGTAPAVRGEEGGFCEGQDTSSWLDFDELRLADSLKKSSQRGKLLRGSSGAADRFRRRAMETIRSVDAPLFAQPPATVGFDHIIHAMGTPDIPSDGIVHRIPLASGTAESAQSLVSVPVRDEGVYREAVLKNPFSMPLLSGPADVFFEGVLLTTDKMDAIGRGGTIRMGLGLEERVRVVRNARTRETVRGVLGGDTEVRTEVEIEVQSLLGTPTEFILLDRYPSAESSDVAIELAPLEEGCSLYDQKDRSQFLEGGLRWEVKLNPGERRVFHFAYTMTFSSKFEVEGGNRRD